MTSLSFRRTTQIVAAILLLWTAADLLYCHVCGHGDAAIRAQAAAAVSAPSANHDGPVQDDHCFCCSHRVAVGSAFTLAPRQRIASVEAEELVLAPPLTASRLYHPPLA